MLRRRRPNREALSFHCNVLTRLGGRDYISVQLLPLFKGEIWFPAAF